MSRAPAPAWCAAAELLPAPALVLGSRGRGMAKVPGAEVGGTTLPRRPVPPPKAAAGDGGEGGALPEELAAATRALRDFPGAIGDVAVAVGGVVPCFGGEPPTTPRGPLRGVLALPAGPG